MSRPSEPPLAEGRSIQYVSGIDIGSQSCLGCMCSLDKRVLVKPMEFANTKAGWEVFVEKLEQLGVAPSAILVGMEATARYGENLYQELEKRGYAHWSSSNAIPVRRRSGRQAWSTSPPCCVNWHLPTTDALPPSASWKKPGELAVVDEPRERVRRVCGSCVINWNIPEGIWLNWKRSWTA